MDNVVDLNKRREKPIVDTIDDNDEALESGFEILNTCLAECDGFFAFTFSDELPTASMILAGSIQPDEAIEALNYAHKVFKEIEDEDV
jgi:hypothetical protein